MILWLFSMVWKFCEIWNLIQNDQILWDFISQCEVWHVWKSECHRALINFSNVFGSLFIFFLNKNSFKNTIKTSKSLDPNHARQFSSAWSGSKLFAKIISWQEFKKTFNQKQLRNLVKGIKLTFYPNSKVLLKTNFVKRCEYFLILHQF